MPKQALQTIRQMDGDRDPPMGVMNKQGRCTQAKLDMNQFERELREYFYQSALLIMTDRLQKAFLGEQRKISNPTKVQNCKQLYWDKATQKIVCLTVDEFYGAHSNKLCSLDGTDRYSIDIATTFYHNLRTELRSVLESNPQPQFSIPQQAPNEDHMAAKDRVLVI